MVDTSKAHSTKGAWGHGAPSADIAAPARMGENDRVRGQTVETEKHSLMSLMSLIDLGRRLPDVLWRSSEDVIVKDRQAPILTPAGAPVRRSGFDQRTSSNGGLAGHVSITMTL